MKKEKISCGSDSTTPWTHRGCLSDAPTPCGVTSEKAPDLANNTLEEVIAAYSRLGKNDLETLLDNLAEAALTHGPTVFVTGHPDRAKKNPHQYHMPWETVKQAVAQLVGFPRSFKNFEDLYDSVKALLGRINQFGNLAVYDFSVRYGHSLSPKIQPKDYVYLHQGTLEGAKALYAKGVLKFRPAQGRYPVTDFPEALQKLGAMHIENLLCIYHPRQSKKSNQTSKSQKSCNA